MNHTKKNVIVTGACGLLGKQIVNDLNAVGFNVISIDKVLGHDLCNEPFVKSLFVSIGRAEHLVNLFGYSDHVDKSRGTSTLFDLPLESFSASLDVNLTALFSVCREYARNNQFGNIVNFGASTGIVSARTDMYGGSHKHVGYSVSKAGVIHLTKILASHLAPNIRVNCISPGGVEHAQSEDFKELYGQQTPMRRMMYPRELAPAVLMLLDDTNTYMTGANIVIDGGWTLI